MGTLKVNNIQSTTDGSVTFPQGSVNSSNSNITGNLTVGGTTTVNNVRLPDGNVTTPSVSFTSDTNTGLYRISEDKIGVSIGGVRTGEIGSGYGGFTGNIIQFINSDNEYPHSISRSSDWTGDILSAVGVVWEISIIPRYLNSKILILRAITGQIVAGSAGAYFGIAINRKIGANPYSLIYTPYLDGNGSAEIGNSGGMQDSFFGMFIDSPNSTSLISYKFSVRNYGSSTFVHAISANGSIKSKSFIALVEIQQ